MKDNFQEAGDSVESQLSLKMPSNRLRFISKNKMEEGMESDMELLNNGIDKNLRLKRKISSLMFLNRSDSHQQHMEEFFTKFLEKHDVIEIWFSKLDDDKIFQVIQFLYDNIFIPTQVNEELFKLLIKYEKMNIYDLVLEQSLSSSEGIKNIDISFKEDSKLQR